MVIHVKNILLGWWRWLTHWNKPTWANDRIRICDACEFNDKGWCDICGCKLPQKALVEDEICHANKWPNVNDYGNSRKHNEKKH